MRSILSFLISFLIVAPSWGQMYDPVKWSFNVDVVNENKMPGVPEKAIILELGVGSKFEEVWRKKYKL